MCDQYHYDDYDDGDDDDDEYNNDDDDDFHRWNMIWPAADI